MPLHISSRSKITVMFTVVCTCLVHTTPLHLTYDFPQQTDRKGFSQ